MVDHKRPIQFQFIYNKSSTIGLKRDCELIETALRRYGTLIGLPICKARHLDFREPLQTADVQIHMEIPNITAIPWAPINYLMVISERFHVKEWSPYLQQFTGILCKDEAIVEQLEAAGHDNIYFIPWSGQPQPGQQNETWISFIEALKQVFTTHLESPTGQPPKKLPIMPPILLPNDCPKISIVTLLHNRRKFTNIACHNLLITDYPHNKIEWVVVDDSDSDKSASDIVIGFGNKCPDLTITYIPLDGKHTIGEKRNFGVERAEHDIILFMDDDDHYPVTSFRRRVAWLTAYPQKQVAVCTTIACYDLMRGISSVNIPPWKLSQGARISEATLTFRRAFWNSRHFPLTNVSEGEEWINGRESAVIEMPPQQIIVAFTHNENTSSRNVPDGEYKPGCFWGFPREYLEFIHGIVGIKVEAE